MPLGISIQDLLGLADARAAAAVQVGGPSGQMIGQKDFHRLISFDDLATGGAVTVFGPERDIIHIAAKYMDFFVEESCGYCTPCRVGNVLLKEKLEHVLQGRAEAADLAYLEQLCQTIKLTSRCGLGQTSPNPVRTTLTNFRPAYEKRLKKPAKDEVCLAAFDIRGALQAAESLIGRKWCHSVH